jgi:hypothetical protein
MVVWKVWNKLVFWVEIQEFLFIEMDFEKAYDCVE